MQTKIMASKKRQQKKGEEQTKSAAIYAMEKSGALLDMNNYSQKFIMKRSKLRKNKDAFVEFYQDHALVHLMIDYCETINVESIETKMINIDTATEYFQYQCLSEPDDIKYTKALNKLKEVIEDSFKDPEEDLSTKYTPQEAKHVFEKELKARVVEYSFKFETEKYQD